MPAGDEAAAGLWVRGRLAGPARSGRRPWRPELARGRPGPPHAGPERGARSRSPCRQKTTRSPAACWSCSTIPRARPAGPALCWSSRHLRRPGPGHRRGPGDIGQVGWTWLTEALGKPHGLVTPSPAEPSPRWSPRGSASRSPSRRSPGSSRARPGPGPPRPTAPGPGPGILDLHLAAWCDARSCAAAGLPPLAEGVTVLP